MTQPNQVAPTAAELILSQQKPAFQKLPLHKSLHTLNKLMADIASVREKIASQKSNLDAFEQIFSENVVPLQTKSQALHLEIFHILCGHIKSGRLKKRLENQLKDALIDFAYFLEDTYGVDLKVGMAAIFGEAMTSDEEEEMMAEFEALAEETFKNAFGDKAKFKSEDGDPFADDLFENFNESSHAKKRPKNSSAKSTPHKSAEEQAVAGDIRALYLLLARALHPDKETDENLRSEKTRWMQKVTKAYGDKNLADLLDILGTNPLNAVGPYLSEAPAKTLQGFTKRLKRELTTLEKEARNFLSHLPIYMREVFLPTGALNSPKMNQEIKGLKKHIQDLEKKRTALRTQAEVERIIPLFKKFELIELLEASP